MGYGGDSIAENEVRVCLTRCPLSRKEIQAHSLPCHVDFDGTAQVKSYFQPEKLEPSEDGTTAKDQFRAEFRGIVMDAEKISLKEVGGYTGLVLSDDSIDHSGEDYGKVWEVESSFDNIMIWNVPNYNANEPQIEVTLQEWSEISSALHTM